MVKLVRTQQAQFELGKNVIEWDDMKAEDTARWEAQVQKALGAGGEEDSGGVGELGVEGEILGVKPEGEILGVKPERERGSESIQQQG